ncbi:hypothetical protein [Sapientia aquatica]|uniref:Uncharacterized protein n=1 Tax=Sapientia aquatica TaxID=1549640 RepID=A0A4R5W1Y4_9BURK|nr:hypothetical protein [Sapientia aquatica]TDK66375.1 hypothetical protein E2I14_07830 [Sapientia aquatica]
MEFLPLTDNKGNSLTYDIVIRGRQMQTMLISGVTPTGSFTGPTLSGAAVLSSQTNPLAATYAAEYSAQLSVPLAPLTNGHIVFEQTPCQSSLATCTTGVLPHEIRWADTNPFTGDIKSGDRAGLAPWAQNFNLVTSGLLTAKYVVPVTAATAPSTALTFSPVGNTEGAGNYSVVADEKAYYNFSSPNLLNWTSTATTETVNLINLPTLISTVQNGTVNGTVSVATAGKYVTGQLIVARSGQTVTAQDISTNLITAGNFNFTVTGLGAGSATTEVGGAYYYAYLRLFNSAGKRTIVSLPGFIDLRFTNSVSGLNVSI